MTDDGPKRATARLKNVEGARERIQSPRELSVQELSVREVVRV